MEGKNENIFFNATINELKKGYVENDNEYSCLICNEQFEKGQIYTEGSKLYDAEKMVKIHINKEHNSMLDYLINMNVSFTGLTEVQKQVISLIAKGHTDKEISKILGVAGSTIRNHRYKLREKEKQARVFLAMMDLLANNTNKSINKMDSENLCDCHKSANQIDDRYNITDKERASVIKAYFDENGAIETFPSKAKKKVIVLSEISKNFKIGIFYSEKEVNRVLKRIYEDYVTIRRALIEYGFLERSDDCSKYWVKE